MQGCSSLIFLVSRHCRRLGCCIYMGLAFAFAAFSRRWRLGLLHLHGVWVVAFSWRSGLLSFPLCKSSLQVLELMTGFAYEAIRTGGEAVALTVTISFTLCSDWTASGVFSCRVLRCFSAFGLLHLYGVWVVAFHGVWVCFFAAFRIAFGVWVSVINPHCRCSTVSR